MEIKDKLNELDFDQACELCGLIYFSYTKSTTVLHQRDELDEWGFDIPRDLVAEVDQLSAVEQMLQAIKLSTKLVKEIRGQLSSNIFCQALNRQQILGLCALICIAQRESSHIIYQWEEYGFGDVPLSLISQIDELTDEEQIELVATVITEPGPENTDKAVYIA